MRTSGSCARNAIGAVAAAALVGAAIGAERPSAQVLADVTTMLARVGERVEQYYRRAQSLMCVETVVIQSLGNSFAPDDLARILEYELRVDWEAPTDGALAPEANVSRRLMKINGRVPKPGAEPGCMDPKSISPEPLAFLLPPKRDEYAFEWNRSPRTKDGRTLKIDYKSRAFGKPVATFKGDCISLELPGYMRGQVWVDAATNDVVRIEEQLARQVDYRLPREQVHFGDGWWIIERADTSIHYKQVQFKDPEETLLLPDSIEYLQVTRGLGHPRIRISQRFSNYRRFLTGGRIVKEQ
jgi:hypothetical protein